MSAEAAGDRADLPVTEKGEPEHLPASSLFDAVVGQDRGVGVLRAAATRPVHAYLFSGRSGAGSRAAASGFAAALLCPRGGCGQCDACRRALAGTHPDLVVVERTGQALDVDDARRLGALSLRRPVESVRQVLVVPDVHLAVRSAPALLKALEEPPASTVFVLLADDVPPELVTVASRCVEVAFPPVRAEEIATWLSGRGTEPDRARLVAAGAGGDVERARLLVEDADYAERVALWQSIPSRLDGHGAVAGALASEVLAATDRALDPLRTQHARELETLEADAKASGERGVPGRRELVERQHRKERRWRTDELRTGLGVLARAYLERLGDEVQGSDSPGPAPQPGSRVTAHPVEAAAYRKAVTLVTETAAALRRNASERLLLEALFVRLGQRGG